MFYIVESEESLSRLESLGGYGCFLHVISTNDNIHPKLSEVVAVYVRPLVCTEVDPRTGQEDSLEKGYIIPVTHDEGIGVSIDRVQELLSKFKEVFILDKKAGLYFFRLGKNVFDLSLKYSMTTYKKLELLSRVLCYNWFYNRYGGLSNLNRIIPLSKVYEHCEDIYDQIQDIISWEEPRGYAFYNEYMTKAYFLVEQSGLRVDIHEFVERFKPTNPEFSMQGEVVYNSYNLNNATSRPTNSFNAVNFLAIPKGKEFRRLFKPQNSKFVEMDFDGYHIRLVADLVGYPLSCEEKAHKQLAKQYLHKSDFSAEEYAKAKALNFQMIYGSPSEECGDLEFSRKIQRFIVDFWKEFEQGTSSNLETGKVFSQELEDMYPQKLFNYLIQSLETSRNVRVLYRVLKRLQHCKTKVVLVTYDSFLIDWDEEEEGILEEIKDLMEQEQGELKYPVGIKVSDDLNF